MRNTKPYNYVWSTASALAFAATAAWGQQTAAPQPPANPPPEDEQIIVLSPFEVSTAEDHGYTAATTLAGNRLNTELRDIGNAVTVVTPQFLKDIGATNNETLLQYTTGSEVGNVYGNFAGTGDGALLDESNKFIQPNSNTRVRGLSAADNTRDFFMTDIPWDGYSVDGVDLQRGPNSILFGQGSPAGIINIRTKQASFRNSNEVTARYGSFGSTRTTVDFNRVLLKDELAIRVAAVYDGEKYKQDPAYEDQRRLFGALRYEPKFLKKGSARTIIKANFEAGEVSSNRPRSLPPIDMITPWFQTGTYDGKYVYNKDTQQWSPTATYNALNQGTFIPAQLQDNNTGLPNHGQMRPNIQGAGANPYYQPALANFGGQYGGLLSFFDYNSSAAQTPLWNMEPSTRGGRSSTGAIDRSIGGQAYQRMGSVARYSTFAQNAGLPYAQFGVYKDKSLTDPTIFDFYNNLLDGPNKHEWQNFRTFNLSLAQTFLDDQIGFELVYNNEWWKGGQISLLSGDRQGIYIDVNSVYADGTPAGTGGEPFADGTPNPNVGRAFVADNGLWGNTQRVNNKEASRATVFVSHDFTRDGQGIINRFLGKHTITGLAAKDENRNDTRNWSRYAVFDENYQLLNGYLTENFNNDNLLTPNTVVYLSDGSLAGRSSASGAYLNNLSAKQAIASGTIHVFNPTWNKPTDPSAPGYIDPGAAWENPYYPASNTAHDSTQSENPANYVGWGNVPVTITDSEADPANRDALTHTAQLQKMITTSTAAVWQGHFWDNSIVGTYGVRKDVSKSWSFFENYSTPSNLSDPDHPVVYQNRGIVNLSPDVYRLSDEYDNQLTVISHAWTVMAHLNDLPFISRWTKTLPVQVSLFYNISTNFQPASQRVDIYGDPIAPPSGKTIDRGILLETSDGKYSLKVNKYVTKSVNGTSGAIDGWWFIGSSQAWAANWVNRFEFNWTSDTNAGAVGVNDPNNSQYNYGTTQKADGSWETLSEAQAREASVIAAWRDWQGKVNPKFYQAWGINLNDPTHAVSASQPAGMAVTEDSTSEGYEFEFNAQATPNWRLTFNASKTTAVRTNIGGAALTDFVDSYQAALHTGKGGVGDLRIWWGGEDGTNTTLIQWNSTFGSNYALRKLQEGTNVPEMREWRFNAISNYDFDRGFMKGVNVGMGVRYESDIVIGFPPAMNEVDANTANFDLNHPYKGPSEINYDFWAGYTRKLTSKIDWNIQLNIRNAFAGNELIPVTVQPDGSAAGYRIRPPRTWELTNTFRF